MMKSRILTALLLTWGLCAFAQEERDTTETRARPFIAYDIGEAAFNSFQSLSGEVGVLFPNRHMLRLVHMNVRLTEKHLSSDNVIAVDGPDVRGTMLGVEAFYDFPIAWNTLYIAPSVGYYENGYEHLELDERVTNSSATIGVGLSFRETDVFGLKGLYYTASIPMRISLDPLEETLLGDTRIVGGSFDNNIWLFIGYQF